MDTMIVWLLYGLMALYVALSIGVRRYDWPRGAIALNWLRWVVCALLFALCVRQWEWSMKPMWVLMITAMGAWFILETMYYWVMIDGLSKSEYPLFPVFRSNVRGMEWPTEARCLMIKDSIEQIGFRHVQSLIADMGELVELRSSVFESMDQTVRLQVFFIPGVNGQLKLCYALMSHTAEGCMYLTDNVRMPYGGYYPDAWMVERRPLVADVGELYALHVAHVKSAVLMPWIQEPLMQIQMQQQALRAACEANGFFNHSPDEDEGRISYEGRYRFWKELWMLRYFGVPGASVMGF